MKAILSHCIQTIDGKCSGKEVVHSFFAKRTDKNSQILSWVDVLLQKWKLCDRSSCTFLYTACTEV